MNVSKRQKEISFQCPHYAVDLVERALDSGSASVVCVARSESKLFIAFEVFQQFRRRTLKAGLMVLLVDDESAQLVKPFLDAMANQSLLSVKTYFGEDEVIGNNQWLPYKSDILVAKASSFLQFIKVGVLDLTSISLIILDQCHHATYPDHPFALLLNHADNCELDTRPKIVGLSLEISCQLSCLQDTEGYFSSVEETFNCKASVSYDLLALNKYGECSDEELVYYTYASEDNQLTCDLKEILQNAIIFLKDIKEQDATQECIKFLKHVLKECRKVLLLFGPEHTAYIAKIAIKEIMKFEKKCFENCELLILQYCTTQLSLVVNWVENGTLERRECNLTDLTEKLLFHMSMHLKPDYTVDCSSQGSTCQDGLCVDSGPLSDDQTHVTADNPTGFPEQQPVDLSASTQLPNNWTVASQPQNLPTTYGSKIQCDDPLCVILVPSTIIAKALNSLINKLSDKFLEYNFLKSACVCSKKAKQEVLEQGLIDEVEDKVTVMDCIQDGSVNVLVATFEIEKDLYARRCSLLIRQGMPKDYKHYFSVKRRLKSAGAKFIVLVRQTEEAKAEKRFKIFQGIENILAERCPNCRLPCCEVKKLFLEDQPLTAYEPYGEGGAKVDLLSSISLLNSYCSKFPSSGTGSAIPVCRTKEVWSENEVEFMSTLYLPRNSPVYWPIQASVTVQKDQVNEETSRKARIKSEMCVALETCRQLHKAGELDDDLQPLLRFQQLHLTAESEPCECEVADNGVGLDGSIKRVRAYKRKFPSVLEDNFPVPDEPCYVYSVSMELTKAWTFERAVRSQSKVKSSTEAVYCPGILSRKPLPKLPAMLIFDRAGEVTVTVTECISQPFVPTSEEISLFRRFTGYIFKETSKQTSSSVKDFVDFDPSIATSGYYIALLKNVSGNSQSPSTGLDRKEIALDFLQTLEKDLGSFDNPTDPPPIGIQNMEIFKDAVVTSVYSDKYHRFYVADICNDRSPADPFPKLETAATFAEYYQLRYGVEVTLNQPMLDVDHVTSRLNFLQPRYSTIKGQNLSIPSEYSKRSQRAKVFVIPELCSVHPLPGYIWRQLFILPSVLYRFESLLVAEELRSSVAKALNRGAVEWPNDVPLPLLNLGEMVGEEIVMQRESVPNDPCDVSIRDEAIKPVITELVSQKDSFLGEAQDGSLGTSVVGTTPAPPIAIKKTSVSSDSQEKLSEISESYSPELRSRESFSSVGDIVRCYTELPKALSNMRISGVENPDNITVKNQICQEKPSNGESTSCCGAGKCSLSASEACSSGSNLAVSEHVSASVEKDATFSEGKLRPLEAADSKVSPSTIWTDPRLSRLYRSCGPSSTLILRALTTCSANDTFSLERLEVLGDSFMKYAISASVFFEHRHQNEGKLSFIRGLKVSNRQLLYLARHRDLPSYMITRTFNPLSNWLPPGFYHVVDDDSDLLTTSEMFLTSEKTPLEIKEDEEEESLFVQNEAPGPNLTDSSEGSVKEGHPSGINLSPYFHHSCSDKTVADATEALIGAYLLCYGPEGAWSFLEWLGMELTKHVQRECPSDTSLSKDTSLEMVEKKSDSKDSSYGDSKRPYAACEMSDKQFLQVEKRSDDAEFLSNPVSSCAKETLHYRPSKRLFATEDNVSENTSETVPIESARLSKQTSTITEITTDPFLNEAPLPRGDPSNSRLDNTPSHSTFTHGLTETEQALNYRFRDHSLLLQAFTHTTLPRDYNPIPSSYEQLEFLGDALLDFLVTRHLYLNYRNMSPGNVTDLRSAVVNNYSFAVLAVKLGFAKHLKSLSPPLFHIVNKFIVKLKEQELKQQQEKRNEIYSSVFVLGSEDSEEFVEVEVPKVLGDLFEAVAGAVYVDCGQDLDKVWQIYRPILKPTIDYFSANPPMSAVRRLLEMKPNSVKFAPLERMVDGKFKSTLTLLGCGTFVGTGRNFRIAKSSAAQKALNALKQKMKKKS